MARKVTLILMTIYFLAMVSGVSLHLHLSSHDHSHEHDSDDCSICRQLLVSLEKFAAEPQTSLPDKDLYKESVEFVLEFNVTAFYCKPLHARPPPSCL
ncbi:MAG: hypothetical protein ACYSTT_05025 [Planctomycetota bacterium]|jgi:hypothetical protein